LSDLSDLGVVMDAIHETWREIEGFSSYEVSDLGNVFNVRRNTPMRTSINNHGHVKISLMADNGERRTVMVKDLVADAFVEPPNHRCDHVVVLDGDMLNVAADNLTWRTKGFTWKYIRQLRTEQPLQYKNLPIFNVRTGDRYNSIIAAGTHLGLLFDDIWRSTYTGAKLFPYGDSFEVVHREGFIKDIDDQIRSNEIRESIRSKGINL
jgi:hypothetical protein